MRKRFPGLHLGCQNNAKQCFFDDFLCCPGRSPWGTREALGVPQRLPKSSLGLSRKAVGLPGDPWEGPFKVLRGPREVSRETMGALEGYPGVLWRIRGTSEKRSCGHKKSLKNQCFFNVLRAKAGGPGSSMGGTWPRGGPLGSPRGLRGSSRGVRVSLRGLQRSYRRASGGFGCLRMPPGALWELRGRSCVRLRLPRHAKRVSGAAPRLSKQCKTMLF